MARRNGINTVKLQLTVDENTDRVIGEMVPMGVLGTTKAEVASSIIRNWIWSNQEQLGNNGINITPTKND